MILMIGVGRWGWSIFLFGQVAGDRDATGTKHGKSSDNPTSKRCRQASSHLEGGVRTGAHGRRNRHVGHRR